MLSLSCSLVLSIFAIEATAPFARLGQEMVSLPGRAILAEPGAGVVRILAAKPAFATGIELRLPQHAASAQYGAALATSPSGLLAVSVAGAGRVELWSLAGGAPTLLHEFVETPLELAIADFGADGNEQLLIGTAGADNRGRLAIYDTASFALLQELVGQQAEEAFASRIAVGDFDGDGHDDLLAGAFGYALPEALSGRVYLFAGPLPLQFATAKIQEPEAGRDRLGLGLAVLGDLDGDGRDEYLTAAPTHDQGGLDSGRIYFHRGATPMNLNPEWFVDGDEPDMQLGWSACRTGDLDGDGAEELAVGAPFAGRRAPERGQVWLLSLEGGLIDRWLGASDHDHYGRSLLGGSDWNLDGADDLLIGIPGHASSSGQVEIRWGDADLVANTRRSFGALRELFSKRGN